jgi:SecD/SecF fusion protein
VYTHPTVNEAIVSGNTEITGAFTIDEAKDIANILKSGKMPAPARIEGIEIVGPSLGAATVNQGFIAFLAGFICVLIFTFAYYRRLGAIADIALAINLFFVVGIMSALQVVLTLPGIAGIVLSMGMAVDANVLIYERMREELKEGKGIRGAITSGFNSALSAIIDGNITTFLTGLILFAFGSGPIAGFAVTLMIGIVTTLVSALLVTRILLERAASKPETGEKLASSLTGFTGFIRNAKYKFIPNRKKSYALTGVVFALAILAMVTLGFRTGIDFQGGRQYTVAFSGQTPSSEQVAATLSSSFGGVSPLVRTIGTDNQMLITTSYRISEAEADDAVKAALISGLAAYNITPESIVRETKVGPTVARDIQEGAIKAVLFALLVMFGYIFLRFQRWQFGVSAIVSLAFNVVVTLGVFSALGAINGLPFSVEIDQNILAALLTIVGYTINDTVVVFDYIRDALRSDKTGEDPESIFNRALNETLSRTIITSVTTLISVIILFFFAGDTLQGFMFALFIGIIVGTFSSLLVASPLALDMAKKSLLAEAKAKADQRKSAMGTSRKKVAEELA